MDETRIQTYLNTIADLLRCATHAEAMDILAEDKEWIDEGFLIALEQVAGNMANQSRQLTADWLLNLKN
ncbi:MAG: hypothetical protein KME46_14220 [Brasilonema angustatum HA4187-MV1]|jgi:hypothetical protein|nr:hypothetical protein [Brasilonema angustatum HA4187-MV1]